MIPHYGRTRFHNLDALRGIAALLVVWQHSGELFVNRPEIARHGTFLADMANTLDFGRIGVICFFLISGFVIPYSLSGPQTTLREFAIRRFFRMYPAYWFSLLAVILLTLAVGDPLFPAATVAANTTMLQGLFGFPDMQGLYWTLTVEIIFYALCAAAFALGVLERPLPLLLVCWTCLGLFVLWELVGRIDPALADFSPTVTYIPYCLAVMFCGALIRYSYLHKSGQWFAFLAVIGVFSLPLLVLLLHMMHIDLMLHPVRFGASHLIALAVFCAVLLFPGRPPSLLLTLGVVSYSIYLLHPLAIRSLTWVLEQSWAGVLAELPIGAYIGLTAAMTFPFAWAVYQLVERPSIDLGRRLCAASKPRPIIAGRALQ